MFQKGCEGGREGKVAPARREEVKSLEHREIMWKESSEFELERKGRIRETVYAPAKLSQPVMKRSIRDAKIVTKLKWN